ncbi:1-acyl-sn-glycerol-3-phosphate acyltransferase [Planctobacterium marinum]|uniref:1-acyl-sn-glycerol-3-phosphate acyltransferase n=1 Tax=Planctobacterium marinum TaxID=1631968 RepID=A0AA48HIN6_9ALTE|nr:1-acyl-sn-glycerol-3-phosphate acyltransferase [Planctobacterium marinum]
MRSLQIPAIPASHTPRKNPITWWLGVLFLKVMGWRFRGQLPEQRQYIMAIAPHTSNWDFVISLAAYFCLRVKMGFMMKASIFIWPFAGLLKGLGGIPVDRSRRHGVVEQMVARFKSQPDLIVALAPEGTRRRVDKWKTGFLQMAHQAQIPVFLVGLDYKAKELVFGPAIDISEDIEEGLQRAQAFFTQMRPKFPQLSSVSGER